MPTLLNIKSSITVLSNIIYIRSHNKPINISELQLNLQILYISKCAAVTLININNEKKTLLQENFDLTINFDLMLNFDFFWPNNFGVVHDISVKFGLWTFHKLLKLQKIFDFIDFWLP